MVLIISACGASKPTTTESSEIVSETMTPSIMVSDSERVSVDLTYNILNDRVLIFRLKETRKGPIYEVTERKIKVTSTSREYEKVAKGVTLSVLTVGAILFMEKGRELLDPNTFTYDRVKTETSKKKTDQLSTKEFPLNFVELNLSVNGKKVHQAKTNRFGKTEEILLVDDIIGHGSEPETIPLQVQIEDTNYDLKLERTIEIPKNVVLAAINKNKREEVARQKRLEERRQASIERARIEAENTEKLALQKVNMNNLETLKTKCTELGFKKGTEKFGECVLKLSE